MRSIKLEDIESEAPQDNSIIIEEKEHDESTKYSDQRKKSIVLPEIKHKTPRIPENTKSKLTVRKPPTYYYSLHFERNKLGTMSTKVIKEKVDKIRKKCQSIASQLSERGDAENSSTTDTPKNGRYLSRITKEKNTNNNHRLGQNKVGVRSQSKLLKKPRTIKNKPKGRNTRYN